MPAAQPAQSEPMRCNRDLVLQAGVVTLVPYRAEHVPTYHGWMSDPWLQEMTASEPLSLEEEYAMCKSWQEDEDKLTFILLDSTAGTGIDAMVGDVNLFFHAWLREEGDADYAVAEIEVMIGEPSARRKGMATAAVQTMLDYAATELATRKFVAKIKMSNEPSLAMFSSRLGFVEVDRDDGFQEIELQLTLGDEDVQSAKDRLASIVQRTYDSGANSNVE